MDEKLDELKRNMTADLPPQAATFIGGILDKLKNGTSEADKIAGIVSQCQSILILFSFN